MIGLFEGLTITGAVAIGGALVWEGRRRQKLEDRLDNIERKDKSTDVILKGIQENLTSLTESSIKLSTSLVSLQGDVKDLKTDMKDSEKAHQKIFEAVSDIRVNVAKIEKNGHK